MANSTRSPFPLTLGRHTARGVCQAFSLTELLIVVAIIAVLAALLMPVLKMARETAFSVNCLSNERQVSAALLAYTADNRG